MQKEICFRKIFDGDFISIIMKQETREKRRDEIHSLDLASFLIMPIQRVPRYSMLLKDLAKHTWPEHPDYSALKNATEKMESIAADLNEKKREAENFSSLIELQNCIIGNKCPVIFWILFIDRKSQFPIGDW
jgi:hypothetical protein